MNKNISQLIQFIQLSPLEPSEQTAWQTDWRKFSTNISENPCLSWSNKLHPWSRKSRSDWMNSDQDFQILTRKNSNISGPQSPNSQFSLKLLSRELIPRIISSKTKLQLVQKSEWFSKNSTRKIQINHVVLVTPIRISILQLPCTRLELFQDFPVWTLS